MSEVLSVPHSLGRWELREGAGRCQGEGCKKNGGGMIEIVGLREVSPGVEEGAETIKLCGDCFAFVGIVVKAARLELEKKGIKLVRE